MIDHKTHRPDDFETEFWDYWSQLRVYRDGVEKCCGKKKNGVLGVGITWVVDKTISLL